MSFRWGRHPVAGASQDSNRVQKILFSPIPAFRPLIDRIVGSLVGLSPLRLLGKVELERPEHRLWCGTLLGLACKEGV
jgi:hypothetical protein